MIPQWTIVCPQRSGPPGSVGRREPAHETRHKHARAHSTHTHTHTQALCDPSNLRTRTHVAVFAHTRRGACAPRRTRTQKSRRKHTADKHTNLFKRKERNVSHKRRHNNKTAHGERQTQTQTQTQNHARAHTLSRARTHTHTHTHTGTLRSIAVGHRSDLRCAAAHARKHPPQHAQPPGARESDLHSRAPLSASISLQGPRKGHFRRRWRC